MKVNSCQNSVYRNIFGYFKWESVKEIQMFCERLDFIHIVGKWKFSFLNKLCVNCMNSARSECFYVLNNPFVVNRHTLYLARSVSILLPGQRMHTATLLYYLHHSMSCLHRRGRPITNAAQGYRLELPSTAHASPTSAARNEQCQFSGPYPWPLGNLFAPHTSLGFPAASLKMWWQSPFRFQSYELTNIHSYIQTDICANRIIILGFCICLRIIFACCHLV